MSPISPYSPGRRQEFCNERQPNWYRRGTVGSPRRRPPQQSHVHGLTGRPATEGPADSDLLGRDAEQAEIARLLGSVRDGLGGALVLQGEAGIGKTALLEHTVAVASDLKVLRLVGIESEMQLSYAGLHQLLRPHLGELDALPVQQRMALNVAFGVEEGVVDRLLVAFAALTVLSTVARAQPVLCVVDDGQWLDRESAAVLGFVGRRLLADRVALVIALRQPEGRRGPYEGIARVRLQGLELSDARTLLARASAGPVNASVAERLVAGTGGNPLALLELGQQLTDAQV